MSDSDCSKDEFDEEEIEALERERQRIQAQLEDNVGLFISSLTSFLNVGFAFSSKYHKTKLKNKT